MSFFEYDCDGCGERIEAGTEGTIWCDGPLGLSVLRTHRTQECGRAALEARDGYRMRAGNKPPESKDARARRRGGGGHRHQIPRD